MPTQPFAEAQRRGHEQITFFNYPEVGLKAIVAIHSTVLGPALGGCRMRVYANESEALEDVMRLSEGMTYKSAVAGMDLGGGKACIIADPKMVKGRTELFHKFGECLNHLAGRYITAEDMGTSVEDIMDVKEKSRFIAGGSLEAGHGGDPSPWTALGCFRGLVAACERRYGTKDLSAITVAVQGVGHVGMYLVEHLVKAGAKCVVADTDEKLVAEAVKQYGVTATTPDGIYDVDAQVFSPNAIGQTVNQDTLRRLKCDIIGGAANNQLSNSSVYELIQSKKILYCPDFVINAGGVINVGAEYAKGGWREPWVAEKVNNIYNTVHEVLERSERGGKFPEIEALAMARERIENARSKSKA